MSASSTPLRFAVLVLFFERAEQTIRCVESFLPAGVPVYVLDNGSSAASREAFDRRFAGVSAVHVTTAEKNLGPSAGRNRLIEATDEDWLFFADSDIRVETPHWPKRLRAHIEAHPDVEAWIPRQRQLPEGRYIRYKPLVIQDGIVRRAEDMIGGQTNVFPGGASVVSRRLFERLGTYDEAIFIGNEEAELCLRGLTTGRPVCARHVRNIQLVHEHCQAVLDADREAARARYAQEHLAQSNDHILAKHGVKIGVSDDGAWLRAQQDLLLEGRMPQKWRSPFRRFRKRVRAFFWRY